MKIKILILALLNLPLLMKGQELWQLQPWATDSTYFIGAMPSGEPMWRSLFEIGVKIYQTDTIPTDQKFGDIKYDVSDPEDIWQIWDGDEWITIYDGDNSVHNELTNIYFYTTGLMQPGSKYGDLQVNNSSKYLRYWDGTSWINMFSFRQPIDSTAVTEGLAINVVESPANSWEVAVDTGFINSITRDIIHDSLLTFSGGSMDSTIINQAYGILVNESPVNTYSIGADTSKLATQYGLSLKQNTLVSGTNIKTVNSNSLLGSGNLSVGTVTSVGLTPGTSGTDINVSGSPVTGSGSITLNIPTASASNRGALSSSDWSTFNGKAGLTGTNSSPRIPYFSNSTTLTSSAFLTHESNYLYTGFTEGIHIAGSNASYASGIKFRNDGYTHCTFGLKGSSFVFSNTQNSHLTLWATPLLDRLRINMASGVITVPQLAGSGERLVVANTDGDLAIPTTGVSPRVAYWSGTGALSSTADLRSESNYLYTGYSQGIHINGSSASYASGIKFRNNAYTHCTFGLKGQDFVFSNTASSDVTLWASPSDKFTINMNSGQLTSSNLTGSGTGMVTVDGSGVFGRQAIPTGTVSGTGTNGYMSYWNGTSSQAASTISYGTSFGDTGIGFGLTPANVLGNIDFASGKYVNFRFGSYINTQSTGGGSYSAGSAGQVLAKSDANNSMIWRSMATINGTNLFAVSNITTGTIGGSGTHRYIPKFDTGGSSIINSAIYEDASNNIGVNTTSPTTKVDINGTLRVRTITGISTSIVGRTNDGSISSVGYGNNLNFASGVLYYDQAYAHASEDFSNLSISTSATKLPLHPDSQNGTILSTSSANDEITLTTTGDYEIQFSVECKCNTAGKKVTLYLWHSPTNAIYLESREYFNNTSEYGNWNMFRRVTLPSGGYSLRAITDSGTADLQDCKVRFQIVKI